MKWIKYWIQHRKDIKRWKSYQASIWRCPHCWEQHDKFVIPINEYRGIRRRLSLFLTSYNYWLRAIFSVCPQCGMELYGGLEKSFDLFHWIETDDLEEDIDVGNFFGISAANRLTFNGEGGSILSD